MGKAANNNLGYRKERKFAVQGLDVGVVEAIIRSNPAMFSTAYPARHVNNIYFETPNFQNLSDNISGVAKRKKYRIRWYGDQFGKIEKPVLEIKIKKGLAGTKEHFPLAPFVLKSGFSRTTLNTILNKSDLPSMITESLRQMSPVLLNRYRRRYFHSADRKFRITIDDKLSFIGLSRNRNHFLQRITDNFKVVVELKYATEHDVEAGWISNNFPFRLSKNSKYVNGLNQLMPW